MGCSRIVRLEGTSTQTGSSPKTQEVSTCSWQASRRALVAPIVIYAASQIKHAFQVPLCTLHFSVTSRARSDSVPIARSRREPIRRPAVQVLGGPALGGQRGGEAAAVSIDK